jgi:uncharacterized protein (DUF2384 family)
MRTPIFPSRTWTRKKRTRTTNPARSARTARMVKVAVVAVAAVAAGADAVRKAKRRTTPRQRMLPRPRTALKTRPPRKRP